VEAVTCTAAESNLNQQGGVSMDTKELKKVLAGFGIAGLLAGAGLGVSVNTAHGGSG